MFHRFHCHPTRRDHHCPRDHDEVASRRRQPPCQAWFHTIKGTPTAQRLRCTPPRVLWNTLFTFWHGGAITLPPEELTAPRPHAPGSLTGRNHDITRLTRRNDRSPT